MAADTTRVEQAPRKGRRGSETRRLNAMISMRVTPPDRSALDAIARMEGFKSTQEYLWSLAAPKIEEARQAGLVAV